MRRPIRIQHGGGVATRHGNGVGQLVGEIRNSMERGWQGQDSECASARRIPVDT